MVDPPIKLFKITDLVPRVEFTRAGDTVFLYEVFYETASGKSNSVKVSRDSTKDEIKAVVRESAEKIEGVLKLRE